jgi:hypothetical protein
LCNASKTFQKTRLVTPQKITPNRSYNAPYDRLFAAAALLGLRKYLGLADVRLNLASNWARLLPREAGPRPGLAAVRSGHVMYIEAAAGNGQWLIRDYNSGGGLSRMHVRDVRGYIFVNPHGAVARG